MPTRVRQVGFTGVPIVDGDLVLDELGVVAGDSLNLPRLAAGIGFVSHRERYRALWLSPTGTGEQVEFHVGLDAAPQSAFGVGIAFDQFMSGRLWIGGVDRTLLHGDAEGVALVHLGTYEQDLDVFVRRRARVGMHYVPFTVEAELKHESVRLFSGDAELASAETREAIAFVGLKQDPAVGAWQGEFGVDTRVWREPGLNTRGTFGVRASVFKAENEYEMGTIAEVLGFADYQRARIDASDQWNVGEGVDITGRLRGGWGNRLPIQQTFALGGDDGFAGFRIGELRGTQEAFTSLVIRKKLNSLLRLRIELMAGMVSEGYGVLTRVANTTEGELFGGARAGLEAETPVGPIRVEEGVANTGQRAILIRVGDAAL